jgi:sulfofructose kinase
MMDKTPTVPITFDVIGVGRSVYDRSLMVDTHPEVNQKTVALDRWQGSGSPVPNALCQLSRWGWKTSLQAVIGDDHEGEQIRRDLNEEGVHIDSLKVRSSTRTPTASIWVEKGSGHRTVVLDRDIAPLSRADLSSDAISSARCLLLDGWEAEAAIEAAKIARLNDVDIVLDAGHVREQMDDLLDLCSWIIVPVSFTRDYYGNQDMFVSARELSKRSNVKGVIVTNGAGGCVAMEAGGEPMWFPSCSIQAVDTTGAGDIFHAGFIHGLLKGWSFNNRIRWAAGAAALSVTTFGTRGKLPTREEVLELLHSQQPDGGTEELDT